jgi:hypothetical protein
MDDNLDFDSYGMNPNEQNDHQVNQVSQGNDGIPNLGNASKNSRNANMRGAHSEKPNQRQRNALAGTSQNDQGILFDDLIVILLGHIMLYEHWII